MASTLAVTYGEERGHCERSARDGVETGTRGPLGLPAQAPSTAPSNPSPRAAPWSHLHAVSGFLGCGTSLPAVCPAPRSGEERCRAVRCGALASFRGLAASTPGREGSFIFKISIYLNKLRERLRAAWVSGDGMEVEHTALGEAGGPRPGDRASRGAGSGQQPQPELWLPLSRNDSRPPGLLFLDQDHGFAGHIQEVWVKWGASPSRGTGGAARPPMGPGARRLAPGKDTHGPERGRAFTHPARAQGTGHGLALHLR